MMFESNRLAVPTEPAGTAKLGPSRSTLRLAAAVLIGLLLLIGAYLLGRGSRKAETAAKTQGAPMSVILPPGVELDETAAAAIGLKTVPVEIRAIDRTVKLTGTVEVPPDSRGFVGSRVEGKIADVFVNAGDRVSKGQVLATVQSPAFEQLQVEFLRAWVELPVAEAAAERLKRLLQIEATAQKDVQNAVAQYEAKKGELAGVRERLEILGLSKSQVLAIGNTQELVRALPISAPIGGIVVTRKAVAGSPVNASDPIFEIDNPALVWVEGDVFETQLPEIKAGLPARVTVPAYPDKVFDGKVQGVIPSLDATKRTARLRVVLPNPESLLKPEMFATLSIAVGKGRPGIAVSTDALIEQGGAVFVFVKNGVQFVRQDVQISSRDDRYAEIARGLFEGDVVVTDGKMQIYTKSLYQ
jgi:RND family efflux transporter MFP subunit